jgi:hypothetical protein
MTFREKRNISFLFSQKKTQQIHFFLKKENSQMISLFFLYVEQFAINSIIIAIMTTIHMDIGIVRIIHDYMKRDLDERELALVMLIHTSWKEAKPRKEHNRTFYGCSSSVSSGQKDFFSSMKMRGKFWNDLERLDALYKCFGQQLSKDHWSNCLGYNGNESWHTMCLSDKSRWIAFRNAGIGMFPLRSGRPDPHFGMHPLTSGRPDTFHRNIMWLHHPLYDPENPNVLLPPPEQTITVFSGCRIGGQRMMFKTVASAADIMAEYKDGTASALPSDYQQPDPETLVKFWNCAYASKVEKIDLSSKEAVDHWLDKCGFGQLDALIKVV